MKFFKCDLCGEQGEGYEYITINKDIIHIKDVNDMCKYCNEKIEKELKDQLGSWSKFRIKIATDMANKIIKERSND